MELQYPTSPCWRDLRNEFPIAYQDMGGTPYSSPTLEQIKRWAKRMKVQPSNSLEEICSTSLRFLRAARDTILEVIYQSQVNPEEVPSVPLSQFTKNEISYLESLPDEILVKIFEYVYNGEDTPSLMDYRVLSSRLLGPVTEVKERVFMGIKYLRGIQPKEFCKSPQSFKECLPDSVNKDDVPDDTIAVEFKLPLIFDPTTKDIVTIPSPLNNRIDINLFTASGHFFVQNAGQTGEAVESNSEQVLNLIIYGCSCLIIEYLIWPFYGNNIFFYRKYISNNGQFTLGNILERIREFYATPFTSDELDCLILQLPTIYQIHRTETPKQRKYRRSVYGDIASDNDLENYFMFLSTPSPLAIKGRAQDIKRYFIHSGLNKIDMFYGDAVHQIHNLYLIRPNDNSDHIVLRPIWPLNSSIIYEREYNVNLNICK